MTPERMKKTLLEDPAAVAAELAGSPARQPGEAGDGVDRPGEVARPGGIHRRELERSLSLLWRLSMDQGEPKQVKKSAKKALYLLRSRGVEVDRYRPSADRYGSADGRKRGALGQGDRPAEARPGVIFPLLSIPDSSLDSVLILPVGRGEERALDVYWVVISERGIRRISSSRGNRRQVERFSGEDPAFLIVPPEYALSRFGEALARSQDSVSGLTALPPVLREAEDRQVPHPVIEEIPRALSRVMTPDLEKQLFSREEVGGLGLPEEETASFREQIGQARSSRLIIGDRTPQERVQAVIERFYRAYFTPRRLDAVRTLLLDLALYFHRRGMHGFTGVLLEYADGLRRVQGAPSAAAASRHPFLQFLVYRSLLVE